MLNQESEFEKGKWYYFKDEAAEAEFRNLRICNGKIADTIINGEGFKPAWIKDGNVHVMDLSFGCTENLFLSHSERKFFTEIKDEVEDRDYDYDDSDEQSFEPSDFPLTKITISNNSEAWTVYQMLKAHFKE